MDVAAAIAAIFNVTDKLLDRTPDYDQKKKAKYLELKLRYVEETKRTYPDRDDDLILNLRDEVIMFAGGI